MRGEIWGWVLELWNSRSSCRSVWPRSPWGDVSFDSSWVASDAGGYTHFLVDVYDDIVASVRHGEDAGKRALEMSALAGLRPDCG
jgi:hypothetical protein